jgi:hypothetical protein
MVPPLFRYPSVCYLLLAVLTPVSYIICLVVAELTDTSPRDFVLVPSLAVAMGASPYVFGGFSTVVTILLIWNTWRCYIGFTRRARNSKKQIVSFPVNWLPTVFAAIGALFYPVMSFLGWGEGYSLHLKLHFVCLYSILCQFAYADWFFAKLKKDGMPKWALIWDIAAFLLLAVYTGMAISLFYVKTHSAMTVAAITGYIAIGVLFARFQGLGSQISGGSSGNKR